MSDDPATTPASTDYRAIRIENLKKLAAAGFTPFGEGAYARTGTIADIRALGEPLLAAHAAAQGNPEVWYMWPRILTGAVPVRAACPYNWLVAAPARQSWQPSSPPNHCCW